MSGEFLELEAWAQGFLAAIGPAGRQRLQRAILRDLRRSQSARIGDQLNPDGSPFEPRKPQHEPARFRARGSIRARPGGIRRRSEGRAAGDPMFRKLRQAAHLKAGLDADGVWVGFAGRDAAIAGVHQDGLEDRTSRTGPRIRYPIRGLLGFTDAERAHILDLLADHVLL